jgi:hypothetical protein
MSCSKRPPCWWQHYERDCPFLRLPAVVASPSRMQSASSSRLGRKPQKRTLTLVQPPFLGSIGLAILVFGIFYSFGRGAFRLSNVAGMKSAKFGVGCLNLLALRKRLRKPVWYPKWCFLSSFFCR